MEKQRKKKKIKYKKINQKKKREIFEWASKMAVYYKFKSARDYDSIPIEGQFISVANLKERIFESKHLGRGTDFDLMISNAQTDEGWFFLRFLVWVNMPKLIGPPGKNCDGPGCRIV